MWPHCSTSILTIVFLLKVELLHSSVILKASSRHSVLGDNSSLPSKASLQAVKHTSLSILGYMEITSRETSKASGGGENLLLMSAILFKRAFVSMSI